MKKDKESTRQDRKMKKRKFEGTIPDLPGDVDSEESQELSRPAVEGETKGTKRRKLVKTTEKATVVVTGTAQDGKMKGHEQGKSDKKKGNANVEYRGSHNEVTETSLLQASNADPVGRGSLENLVTDGVKPPKKPKKQRQAERKASEAAQVATSNTSLPSIIQDISAPDKEEAQLEKSKKNNRNREKKRKAPKDYETSKRTEVKVPRFIVFIGNLPFTATTESIQKHFAAVHPKSVRHLTRKDEPEKSKGCAFLEFDGYDHMKACLKSFHHSTFDDTISPPRKINVELTAGGGGKKQNRRVKIAEKNQKLSAERVRRMYEGEKAKLVKRESAIDHSDVHPSRRARVPDIS